MSIDRISGAEPRRSNSIVPVVAALLFIPGGSHAKTNSVFERQPKTDVYEFSAKDLIDLKDDGSYKLVNPDYVDRTTYISASPKPIMPKKEEKKPVNFDKITLCIMAAAYLLALGGLMKGEREINKKDKTIRELTDLNLQYAEKISGISADSLALKAEKDNLIKENTELKAENQRLNEENERLRAGNALIMSVHDPSGRS